MQLVSPLSVGRDLLTQHLLEFFRVESRLIVVSSLSEEDRVSYLMLESLSG